MHISNKIAITILGAFIGLVPTMGVGKPNNCQMVSEADTQYGSLAHDVRLYIRESAGMVVCKGEGSAAAIVAPYVVTRMATINNVRAYRFEIPFIYRDRFPASSELQKYAYDGGNGQAIQFICLIESQCNNFFDAGFAIVDEDIDSDQYPKLVSIWKNIDIDRQISSYQGPTVGDVIEMKKIVKSGGSFLPLSISLDSYDGHFESVYTWVYGSGEDELSTVWSVDLKMNGDKSSIVGARLFKND